MDHSFRNPYSKNFQKIWAYADAEVLALAADSVSPLMFYGLKVFCMPPKNSYNERKKKFECASLL